MSQANISKSVPNQLSSFAPQNDIVSEFEKMKSVQEDIIREYQNNKQNGNLVSFSNETKDDPETKTHKFEEFVEDSANKQTKMLIDSIDKNGFSSIDELYNQNYPNYMNYIKKSVNKLESKIDQANIDEDVSNINSLTKLGDIIKKMYQGSKNIVENIFQYAGKKFIQSVNVLGVQSQFLGALALILFPLVGLMAEGPGTAGRMALGMVAFVIAGRIAQTATEITADEFDIRVMSEGV